MCCKIARSSNGEEMTYMDSVSGQTEARRRFLRMLVASPIFAGSHFFGSSLANLLASDAIPDGALAGFDLSEQRSDVISSPDQAFDVMDFEPAARKALPPA